MGSKIKSDEELREDARQLLVKMLSHKNYLERMEPVAKELQWILKGRPDADQYQKILPDYCYNILELLARTIFGVYVPATEAITFNDKEKAMKSTSVEEAKKHVTIDFDALGRASAMGERGMTLFEKEVAADSAGRDEEICQKFLGFSLANFPWQQVTGDVEKLRETTKRAVPELHRIASKWGPEAVTKFHAGVTKGSVGFLDHDGEFAGVKKINLWDTYQLLLLAWPEIQDMLMADPPKTRNDLWAWLEPFSYAGWIEIEDLEQLNRLCHTLKLRLKKPGAPRKAK